MRTMHSSFADCAWFLPGDSSEFRPTENAPHLVLDEARSATDGEARL